jgi:hypothetical protein
MFRIVRRDTKQPAEILGSPVPGAGGDRLTAEHEWLIEATGASTWTGVKTMLRSPARCRAHWIG